VLDSGTRPEAIPSQDCWRGKWLHHDSTDESAYSPADNKIVEQQSLNRNLEKVDEWIESLNKGQLYDNRLHLLLGKIGERSGWPTKRLAETARLSPLFQLSRNTKTDSTIRAKARVR
jgi:hypothetical protein